MARPPEVIRIKRKRDDETPLTFLELDTDGNKRARSASNWVYKRRIPKAPLGASAAGPGDRPASSASNVRPQIQASAPGDELRWEKQLQSGGAPTTSAAPPRNEKTNDDGADELQRTFHISKADTERLQSYPSQSSLSSMTAKRRRNTVVFVERNMKKMRAVDGAGSGMASPLGSPLSLHIDDQSGVDVPVPATPSTQQRRPLAIPHGRRPPVERPIVQVHDMDKMASVMDAWAREVVAPTEPQAEPPSNAAPKHKGPVSRYKPKPKPKPAASVRSAAAAAAVPTPVTTSITLPTALDDDDSDYVEEEYHIMDPRAVPTDVPRHLIGRLVIDQDEQEYFYEDRNTQMLGYESDESDENAENHYGNDYPDQELESDSDLGNGNDCIWGIDAGINGDADGIDDSDDIAMSDYEDDNWMDVHAGGIGGGGSNNSETGKEGNHEDMDAKLLERIRRFNAGVNRHGGY
ncbi:hypothetical protein CFO_g5460 [Ceratocystis platani]|uniref:Transcription factor Iwr1 domain-containing protein n=1 Tax=Ceratocystis fimbriata f. sp. platani TaxID=88771 RepID=A0A0F8CN75_CERFI|nr:hypothetical protein CFO_g5460 [Ceratocystis platani]